MAREKSNRNDVDMAMTRLRSDAKEAGKTEGTSAAVRAEDLKTLLGYDDLAEALDNSLIVRLEGAVEAAAKRGGSHASVDIATLESVVRKADGILSKAA